MEERHDINYIKRHKKPLNDFDYAYKSEYMTRYGEDALKAKIPNSRVAQIFPGHQPQLDLPQLKKVYNSYETTSRVAYQDPRLITTRKPEIPCTYCRLRVERV
ncbi:uncharacterized protein CDAR_499581 [Caerostris darwini]|uniref:Uncharacterized protein n=1 Tax=Caerostris darwini TaxID=1538125 RepID=A0AAV4TSX5_9ARAC|nr:uncharacterized protein CDAR_499581 [Caerostris darwini]